MTNKRMVALALTVAGMLATATVHAVPSTFPPVQTGPLSLSGFGGGAGAHEFFTQASATWKGDIGGIGPSSSETPWRFEILGIDATGVTGPADRFIYFNIQDSETGSTFKNLGINFRLDASGAAGGTLLQAYQTFTSEGISSHGLNIGDLTASDFDLRFDFYKDLAGDVWIVSPSYQLAGGGWNPFFDGPFDGTVPFDFLGAKLIVAFDGGADGTVSFDNMRLYSVPIAAAIVPEPLSASLGAVALLALVGYATRRHRCRRPLLAAGALSLALIAGAAQSRVQAAAIDLGTAASFAVLADASISNTGPTVVAGDIGVHAGTAITGFFGTVENDGPGNFTGASHQGDAVAGGAKTDALAAYVTLAGLAFDESLGMELGGLTRDAGVYKISSAAQLTGTLTLDGPGQYVFQIGTALTTASDAVVALINGADACDVWFVAGSAATLGTDTDFHGNIITLEEAITLNTRATIDGRLISLGAAVTLDTNLVTIPFCPEPGMPGVMVTDDDGHIVPSGGPATVVNGTDFGTVVLDSPSEMTYIITNTGDETLLLDALAIDGDFALVGLFPDSIAPGESVEFIISMDTSTLGPTMGTVTFDTNTVEGTYTFDLAGNVVFGIPEPNSMLVLLIAGAGSLVMRRWERASP